MSRPWHIAIASANRESDRCKRLLKQIKRLLKQMGLVKGPEDFGGVVPGLMKVFPMKTGTKKEHFEQIQGESNVPFDRMTFFDDSEGNTETAQELGIACGLVSPNTG